MSHLADYVATDDDLLKDDLAAARGVANAGLIAIPMWMAIFDLVLWFRLQSG